MRAKFSKDGSELLVAIPLNIKGVEARSGRSRVHFSTSGRWEPLNLKIDGADCAITMAVASRKVEKKSAVASKSKAKARVKEEW